MRYRVFLEGDENILELKVMVIAQLCEYTKEHWIKHFKSVNLWYVNYISIKFFNVLYRELTKSIILYQFEGSFISNKD